MVIAQLAFVHLSSDGSRQNFTSLVLFRVSLSLNFLKLFFASEAQQREFGVMFSSLCVL